MKTNAELLDQVRAIVGPAAYLEFRPQWEKAVSQDPAAMELAIADYRRRERKTEKGPINNPGGWLLGSWRRQHEKPETER